MEKNKSRVSILKFTFELLFISGVKEYRVQNAARYWLEHGCPRPENRGGNRKAAEYNEYTVFMFTVVYSVVLLHFHIINFQRWMLINELLINEIFNKG